MKTLVVASFVALGLVFSACAGTNSEGTVVTTASPVNQSATAELASPTSTPGTATTLPCYTASDDSKQAIIKILPKMANGYSLDVHTFKLWVEGDCIRGSFDWSLANSFVEAHPGASASELPETPPRQISAWEEVLGLPTGSLDNNVYWVSGIAPSPQVCHILNLKCED